MWFVHSVRRLQGGVQLLKDSEESMHKCCHSRNHFWQCCALVKVAFLSHKAPTSLCVSENIVSLWLFFIPDDFPGF